MMFLFLLQAQQTTTGFNWPPGWAVIGWVVAAIVAIVYLYSGVLQNLSSGRKDLIEVGEKKLASVTKEKEELEYKIKTLEEEKAALEKEKLEIEKDKTLLMREHHQLLEISVADLKTLKTNTKLIEQLEAEINRYREEKGLPPKTSSLSSTKE
jgi:uncharacterized protein (DUF3084 family)